jgi:hypothetical protein
MATQLIHSKRVLLFDHDAQLAAMWCGVPCIADGDIKPRYPARMHAKSMLATADLRDGISNAWEGPARPEHLESEVKP